MMVVVRVAALALTVLTVAAWTAPQATTLRRGVVVAAKGKKGKKKGGGQKKQSGMEWAKNFVVMPYDGVALRQLAEECVNAYEARTGTALVEGAADAPKALWSAPLAVLVAAPPSGDDPAKIAYANAAGCEFLGGDHQAVIGATTELAFALDAGYESKYEKKVSGRTMRDAKRWQMDRMSIVDGALATEVVGVAYAFETWLLETGELGEPGGKVSPPPMDPAEVEAQIDAQAQVVRELKEDQGLANKDPAVVAAVAELLRLKAILEPAA